MNNTLVQLEGRHPKAMLNINQSKRRRKLSKEFRERNPGKKTPKKRGNEVLSDGDDWK